MPRPCPLFSGALLASALFAGPAAATEPVTATSNGTTISVGGGVQLLSLPDMRFTFRTNSTGNTAKKQTNSEIDDYGGVVTGVIETPLGYWGGTPVAGVISGFFANVSDGDRKSCVSPGFSCTAENLVDRPGALDSRSFTEFTTKTDRDVDFWGAGGELRFGMAPEPVPDAGGYLFRFAYWGAGADVRAIDQDNKLRLHSPDVAAPTAMTYHETLDTTYWGGYLTIAGEYNLLGYLGGIGSNLGLRSLLSLRAGVYGADTDYSGRSSLAGIGSARLGLSETEIAFIGGATFETRKQFGPRTSLSLITDYEYYSFVPEMRYVDADKTAGRDFVGIVNRTHISDDDAFEVRTTLRLNIGLGSPQLYPPPP